MRKTAVDYIHSFRSKIEFREENRKKTGAEGRAGRQTQTHLAHPGRSEHIYSLYAARYWFASAAGCSVQYTLTPGAEDPRERGVRGTVRRVQAAVRFRRLATATPRASASGAALPPPTWRCSRPEILCAGYAAWPRSPPPAGSRPTRTPAPATEPRCLAGRHSSLCHTS